MKWIQRRESSGHYRPALFKGVFGSSSRRKERIEGRREAIKMMAIDGWKSALFLSEGKEQPFPPLLRVFLMYQKGLAEDYDSRDLLMRVKEKGVEHKKEETSGHKLHSFFVPYDAWWPRERKRVTMALWNPLCSIVVIPLENNCLSPKVLKIVFYGLSGVNTRGAGRWPDDGQGSPLDFFNDTTPPFSSPRRPPLHFSCYPVFPIAMPFSSLSSQHFCPAHPLQLTD